MSIEKIIQESVNKNPLAMKEALEEELRGRLALALEAKMKKESDDEDESEMDESLDLSEEAMRADIDHMGGHDSIAKKNNITLTKHNNAPMGHYAIGKKKDLQKYLVHHYDGDHGEAKELHPDVFKESFDLSDLTLEELEEAHGVFRKGGSIGEVGKNHKPIKVHDNHADAKAHAKRLNSQLSAGEKKYYGLGYHVKPMKEALEAKMKKEDDLDETSNGLISYSRGSKSNTPEAVKKRADYNANKKAELKRQAGVAKAKSTTKKK